MATTTASNPSLAQKLRGMSGEVVKFGLVGLSGVVVNFVVFWVCLNGLHLASLRSNIAATLVAIATNYLGYRYWLYRDRDAASRKREITLFLVFSGAGMLIETGVLGITVYALGFSSHFEQLAAKVAGLALGTVFRFVSYRTWVFKAVPESTTAPSAAPGTVPAPLAEALAETVAGTAPAAGVVAQAELMLAAQEIRYAKAE
ncbi:GtrA family protein [Streptomyces sp. BE20]|uniref:GtrA family protein n=1 Tax=Streptomycetaceae TaxID=2062 RepID=UPI002E7856A0|nr:MULTISPECIES: GtrA family protein [unclassified Streptomyces]MED7952261.1 GtrA family protein [Streptomyces sp. BE303]MEE1826526.1 GtrA family protein [Streptomyces sp. BE20]